MEDARSHIPTLSCTRVAYDGSLPAPLRDADRNTATPRSGYVLNGPGDGLPIALLNDGDAFRFDAWQLTQPEEPATRLDNAVDAAQNSWAGFYLVDAACITDTLMLLAVQYYHPTAKHALYTYDVAQARFTKIADVDPGIPNKDRYFEYQALGPDSAVALYYTGRTRKAAELYHNYFHHFILFGPDSPSGTELMKLGIDTGNATQWAVMEKTLYLHALDGRDAKNPKEGDYSLDLSAVLK